VEFGHEDKVCLLLKAIHGLKQATQAWYTLIDFVLQTHGFIHSKFDHNLYFSIHHGKYTSLVIYVDNILLVKMTHKIYYIWRKNSPTHFKCLAWPHFTIRWYKVFFLPTCIFLHQCKYATKLSKRFSMANYYSKPTLMNKSIHIQ
jgi:hypothetical protein